MSINRLEGFSDGVLAVAITLLVLGIIVPPPSGHRSLGHELAVEWPRYAAYVTSFITIGIIWINHHAMISRLKRADHAVMILNILLLMSVGVIPFATALLATYLKQGRGQHLAAAIYGAVLLAMAIFFVALNWTILFRRPHLLAERLDARVRRQILIRGATGSIPYVAATALAPVSPYITLAIAAAVAAFYALPVASGLSVSPPGA